jgi:hypothetical protein
MSQLSTSLAEFEVVQEDDTVSSGKVTAITVAGVVVTLAAVAISGAIVAAATRSLAPAKGVANVAPRQIAGIHQTMIERDRHGWEQRERQRRSLELYRWVDRKRGIAQIPIERAMQVLADDDARQRGAR